MEQRTIFSGIQITVVQSLPFIVWIQILLTKEYLKKKLNYWTTETFFIIRYTVNIPSAMNSLKSIKLP